MQDCLLKAFRATSADRHSGWTGLADQHLGQLLPRPGPCQGEAPGRGRPGQLEQFSLYRTIADEDPFPYSDSLHLDFLDEFGAEDVRAVLIGMPEHYRIPLS